LLSAVGTWCDGIAGSGRTPGALPCADTTAEIKARPIAIVAVRKLLTATC
jgi:hypothetical protein